MKSDFRIISHYKYGKALMKEADINRDKNNIMFEAAKIAQAVWGDKRFKDEVKDVDLTSTILQDKDNKEERLKKLYRTAKRLEEQYGCKLRRKN